MRRPLGLLCSCLLAAGALSACFPIPSSETGPGSDARVEQRGRHTNEQMKVGVASEISSSPGAGTQMAGNPLPPKGAKF